MHYLTPTQHVYQTESLQLAGEKLKTILSVCLSRYSENVTVFCLSFLHPGMVKWSSVYSDPT
jgi:hypothetical protein